MQASRPFRAPVPEDPLPPFGELLDQLDKVETICRRVMADLPPIDSRHEAKRILYDTVSAWNRAAHLAQWARSGYRPDRMADIVSARELPPGAE